MAALRTSSSALRASLGSFSSPARSILFNGARCYSSAKAKVSGLMPRHLGKLTDDSNYLVPERYLCRQTPRRNREGQETTKVRNRELGTDAHSDSSTRDYGSKVVGEVTLDQVYGGARGIKSLVWEVSRSCSVDAGDSYLTPARDPYWTLKRASDFVARLYLDHLRWYSDHCAELHRSQNARSCYPRRLAAPNRCPRVSSGCS